MSSLTKKRISFSLLFFLFLSLLSLFSLSLFSLPFLSLKTKKKRKENFVQSELHLLGQLIPIEKETLLALFFTLLLKIGFLFLFLYYYLLFSFCSCYSFSYFSFPLFLFSFFGFIQEWPSSFFFPHSLFSLLMKGLA